MAKLAHEAELKTTANGTQSLVIDGVDFPWHLARQPMTARPVDGGLVELTVTLIVDQVTIHPPTTT